MSDKTALLNSLRDIHEPAAPGVTSPLWIVLLASLALPVLGVLLVRFIKQHRQRNPPWASQLSLARTEQPEKARLRLARLLRHICVRQDSAANSLSGQDWLEYLDKVFSTDYFTQGDGQLFGNSLYAPIEPSININAVCDSLSPILNKAKASIAQQVTK